MERCKRYIDNVLSGKELTGELARLAVERHIKDLEKSKSENWPFYFDEQEAQRAINFLGILRHPSGARGIAGERFKIQDNQAFIAAMLFGWRRKEDGGRRFTKAYLEVSRKWGKSLFAAFVQLYIAKIDGATGGGVFTAATTRHQADEVFRAAKRMAETLQRDSPTARKNIRVMANSINIQDTGCFIQKVSSEAGDIEGKNPVCAVIDEYHAHPTSEVLELMASGMGTWDAPMLFIITTAGFDKEFPCYRVERPNAAAVLRGQRTDDGLFALVFGHNTDDADGVLQLDPDIPEQARQILKLAKKSNPNLGSTPTEKFILDRVREARNKGGSTRVGVLTKNFNCWVDAPKVWIPEESVKAVMRPIDISEFYGRQVFLGLDLAATKDLTALAIFAPAQDETEKALCKVLFWLPEETVNKRNDVAPYSEWSEGGFVNLTDGNIVDYEAVRKFVFELNEKMAIQDVGHDQWNAWETMAKFTENGIKITPVLPRYTYQSEPTKRIEMMVLSGEIELDANPVLLWNFRNIALQRKDDNMMPSKDKSSEKIDGIAAMVDAIYVWLQTISQPAGGSYLFDESAELIIA